MASVDVTVRGAGIFGLSVAWACARRGARVRVIDTAGIGAGSSGGVVGALSPHVPEAWNPKKAFQLESLLLAQDWWAGVEAASGLRSGYGRVGRLQPLADMRAVEVAQRRGAEAGVLWQGHAEWQVIPATGAGWEPASPSGWLVIDSLSARISPRLALEALAAAVQAMGGTVVIGKATDVGPVIHATGFQGLAELSAGLGKRVGSGVKGQALSVGFDARTAAQLFVDGLHIVPHADGTVAIGSTSETVWESDGPDG
jgi:glycine oxidase